MKTGKHKTINFHLHYTLIIVFIAGLSGSANAQQADENVKTRLRIDYFNDSGKKKLVCTLLARENKRYVPLGDARINFYQVKDTLHEPIGVVNTNKEGISTLMLNGESGPDIQIGSSALFFAEFEGFAKYMGSNRQKAVKDVVMTIEFLKNEKNKSIVLNLSEFNEDGELVPADGIPVFFYVPRTFSLLEFDDAEITNGRATVDFPIDIPGDTLGFITIVAKIDDYDDYGTIQASNGINWGIPVLPEKIVKRGLGDTNAPLWMVYTLIVLLSLVWFHYLFAIITIYRIKREGNKIDIPEEQAG